LELHGAAGPDGSAPAGAAGVAPGGSIAFPAPAGQPAPRNYPGGNIRMNFKLVLKVT
jgi:hypothetical protein